MQHVKVTGAPGIVDGLRAVLIPGLHEIPSVRLDEPVTVISTEEGIVLAVPSRCVEFVESPQAEAYRAEWATLAHRNPSDVYIPEALR